MGATFNDEPNYFFRGVIAIGMGVVVFSIKDWIPELDGSPTLAPFLNYNQVPYIVCAVLLVAGFINFVRGMVSVAAHLNSCLMTATLGALVLLTITGVVLFFEYRPDLAAKRVSERKAEEKNTIDPDISAELRIFTAADGRTMKAAFLSFDGKKVKIQRADGKVFTNSISLYSDADSEYIREQK